MDAIELIEEGRRRLPETIDAVRCYRRMTKAELARRMHLDANRVTGWTSGRNRIDVGVLYVFADALGVPAPVLLGTPDEAVRWCLDQPGSVIGQQPIELAA